MHGFFKVIKPLIEAIITAFAQPVAFSTKDITNEFVRVIDPASGGGFTTFAHLAGGLVGR